MVGLRCKPGMTSPYPQNWILLRGLGREAAHWGGFLSELQAAFPLASIHTLDLPGSGRFNRQASPANIQALVEAVRQQALAEDLLDPPCVLLGLSLGGMVAWQWLSQFPGDACAGVLINSSFASLSPFYRRLNWQSYPFMARIITASTDTERERRIVGLVSNLDEKARAEITRRWAEVRQQRPMSALNEMRQILAAARFKPALQAPSRPVLLLNSRGDRLVSSACSWAIHQQYGLPIFTHPTAGHDLPNDDGQWVVRQLQNWLMRSR